MSGIEPVPRERALGLVQEWTEVLTGRPEPYFYFAQQRDKSFELRFVRRCSLSSNYGEQLMRQLIPYPLQLLKGL